MAERPGTLQVCPDHHHIPCWYSCRLFILLDPCTRFHNLCLDCAIVSTISQSVIQLMLWITYQIVVRVYVSIAVCLGPCNILSIMLYCIQMYLITQHEKKAPNQTPTAKTPRHNIGRCSVGYKSPESTYHERWASHKQAIHQAILKHTSQFHLKMFALRQTLHSHVLTYWLA